jgi:hypothetical protein
MKIKFTKDLTDEQVYQILELNERLFEIAEVYMTAEEWKKIRLIEHKKNGTRWTK